MRFRPDFRMSNRVDVVSGNNAFEEHIWRRAKYGATEPRDDRQRSREDEKLAFRIEATSEGRPMVDGSEGAFRKSIFPDTIIILGPTGSGKTGVSIKLAEALNGEIISADSRAIYKGMDIGTAKPTSKEQHDIPHYGLDLVNPGDRFTVADWKSYAEQKITEIHARGKLPIIAGGTGLYIDALIYDYHFKGPTGERIGDFEQKTCTDRKEIKGNYLLVGIKCSDTELRSRLKKRIDQMFCEDLYKETRSLVQQYGWDSQAMKSNIYQFVWQYLEGKLTLEEAKERCFFDDWHLAKRQITWFKRNPQITWLELEKVYSYVIKYIQDEQRK